jgi:hypothetical protein
MLIFAGEGDDNDPKVMEQVGAWWGKYSQSGAIVSGERLQPSSRATTVRFGGDAPSIVDGPFTETKETIGGYAIVEVPDLDAALEMAKTWPASPAVEIRPIWVD